MHFMQTKDRKKIMYSFSTLSSFQKQ